MSFYERFQEVPMWIDECAYQDNKKLETITIPDTVMQIRSRAFAGCVNLKAVEMGAGVTSIGIGAFSRCSSLRSIVIPHGVKSIGNRAFAGCTRLTFIVLPSTVATVGVEAFMGCEHLVVAVIPNPTITFKPQHYIFSGCRRLQYVIAPALLGDPGKHFEHTPLKALGFEGRLVADTPDSRRRVSELQFWSRSTHKLCTAGQQEWVKEVLLIGLRLGSPSNVWVAVIGNIRTCELPEHGSVAKVTLAPHKKNPFFAKKGALPRTTFSSGQPNLASLKSATASNGSSEGDVALPTPGEPVGVDEVRVAGTDEPGGDSASSKNNFQTEAESLAKKLQQQAQRSRFGRSPFGRMSFNTGFNSGMRSFNSAGNTDTPSRDVEGVSPEDVPCHVVARLTDVPGFIAPQRRRFGFQPQPTNLPPFSAVFPEDVTNVESDAFRHCESLITVAIHGKVELIGRNAFRACEGLTSVDISPGVVHIAEHAFSGCKALRSVNLPSSIRTIGANAFNGCQQLKSIDLPHGVESIGNGAFMRTGLESVSIPSTMSTIEPSLFSYCMSLTSVTIPAGIKTIRESSFNGCSQLASVALPPGLQVMEKGLFNSCSSLESLEIPESVTAIQQEAFLQCTKLESVIIPPLVREISPRAFRMCHSLRSVVLPKITTIGEWAFAECKSLESVTLQPGLAVVDAGAFAKCTMLRSADLPSGTTRIAALAFEDCKSLASVNFPEGLVEVGMKAFSCCTSLTSAVLPDTVTAIGKAAFAFCDWLIVASVPNPAVAVRARSHMIGHGYRPFAIEQNDVGVFAGCVRLQFAVAPALVADAKKHFTHCPALTNGGLVEDSPMSRHRASKLTFWSTLTHPLCSPPRRACVRVTLLCAGRLSNQGLHLPPEMWTSILGLVRVHELGHIAMSAKDRNRAVLFMKAMGGKTLVTSGDKSKGNLKFVGKKQRPLKETAADKSDSGLKKAEGFKGFTPNSEKPKLFQRPKGDSTGKPSLFSPPRDPGSAAAAESDASKTSGLWQSKSERKAGGFLSKVERQSDTGSGDNTKSTLWGPPKGVAVFGKKVGSPPTGTP